MSGIVVGLAWEVGTLPFKRMNSQGFVSWENEAQVI